MAPTRAKTESGASRSCVDILAASGYVWSAVEDDHTENRVVRDDGFGRHFDFLRVVTMCMLSPR